MEDLPGYEFAKENGYSLYSNSGSRNIATYTKDTETGTLFLDIERSMQRCKLSKLFGFVECHVGEFSLPNKNFPVFERMLIRIIQIPNP